MSKIVRSQFTPATSFGTAIAQEHRNGEWRYPIGVFRDARLLDPICRKMGIGVAKDGNRMRDSEIEYRRANPDIPLAGRL
jgi:hypothetical protein